MSLVFDVLELKDLPCDPAQCHSFELTPKSMAKGLAHRYIKATIISTGNLVEGLKDKDIIYYDKHAGHGITWANTMYHVIRARDVVLVE